MHARQTAQNSSRIGCGETHGRRSQGCFLIVFCLLLLCWVSPSYGNLDGLTLREATQSVTHLYLSGNYISAHDAFEQLELRFSEETAYQRNATALLPMRAYCAHVAGESALAITLSERYLAAETTDRPMRQLAWRALAMATLATGNPERANAYWQEVIKLSRNRNEAAMATIQQARAIVAAGDFDRARQRLQAVMTSTDLPTKLRQLARLTLIELAWQNQQTALAADTLLAHTWQAHELTNILDFIALVKAITSEFASEGCHERALQLHRYLPAPEVLAQSLPETQRQSEAFARYQDQWPKVLLQRGQLHIQAGNTALAQDVFNQVLASDPEPHLKQRASLGLITCALQNRQWQSYQECADAFLETYPHSPFLPRIQFLEASYWAHFEHYDKAVTVLGSLLEAHPKHPQAPLWQLKRGKCQLYRGNPQGARVDFDVVANDESVWRHQAALWQGLTWMAQGQLKPATEAFQSLLTRLAPDHNLYPFLQYYLATAHRLSAKDALAHAQLSEFLETYPEHALANPARLQLGGLILKAEKPETAMATLAEVTPADLAAYAEATFIQLNWAISQARHAEAKAVLSDYLQAIGNERQAKRTQKAMTSLWQLNPNGFDAWLAKQITDAEAAGENTWLGRLLLWRARQAPKPLSAQGLDKLAASVPPTTMDATVLAALGNHFSLTEPERARPYWRELLDAFPKSPQALQARLEWATQLAETGQIDGAIAMTHPSPYPLQSVRLLRLRAELCLQAKQPKAAIAALAEATQLAVTPRDQAELLLLMGTAYAADAQSAKAMACFQRITIAYPAFPELVDSARTASEALPAPKQTTTTVVASP